MNTSWATCCAPALAPVSCAVADAAAEREHRGAGGEQWIQAAPAGRAGRAAAAQRQADPQHDHHERADPLHGQGGRRQRVRVGDEQRIAGQPAQSGSFRSASNSTITSWVPSAIA